MKYGGLPIALVAAIPKYSAKIPSENRVPPLVTSRMTMTDVHPWTGTWLVSFAQTTHPVRPTATTPRKAPKSVTIRSGRVPEVSTIRQKWDARRGVEKPEGRPRSSRIATGKEALRATTQVRATSR